MTQLSHSPPVLLAVVCIFSGILAISSISKSLSTCHFVHLNKKFLNNLKFWIVILHFLPSFFFPYRLISCPFLPLFPPPPPPEISSFSTTLVLSSSFVFFFSSLVLTCLQLFHLLPLFTQNQDDLIDATLLITYCWSWLSQLQSRWLASRYTDNEIIFTVFLSKFRRCADESATTTWEVRVNKQVEIYSWEGTIQAEQDWLPPLKSLSGGRRT